MALIEMKMKVNKVLFKDLNRGDFFKDDENFICMKIDMKGKDNVACLSTTTFFSLCDDSKVIYCHSVKLTRT